MTDQSTFDDYEIPAEPDEQNSSAETEKKERSAKNTSAENDSNQPESECEGGTVTDETSESIKSSKDVLSNLFDPTDSDGVAFGTDPDEFDIPSKWPRRFLAHRTADNIEKKSLSETTLVHYESTLRMYTNFAHDHDYEVLNAPDDLVKMFILHEAKLGQRTGTVMQKVSIIKGFYEYLILKEPDDISPDITPTALNGISEDAIDKITPSQIQREALTKNQVEELFDHMSHDRNRLMAIVAVETGFRNSDVREIRLQDVDYNKPSITAKNPKNGDPYTNPISQELALELEIWNDKGREVLLGERESEYLFPNITSGQKLTSNSSFQKIINKAAVNAGIQDKIGKTEYISNYNKVGEISREWSKVTPHVLRHTFITLLEKENVSLEYRQLLANHKNPETTQRYSHGKKEVLNSVHDNLNLEF